MLISIIKILKVQEVLEVGWSLVFETTTESPCFCYWAKQRMVESVNQ